MSQLTFNKKGEKGIKEYYEWVNIWCEDANNEKLPRVALVGDSITQCSFPAVKNELKEIACVDYFATSYSITSKTYKAMVKNFLNDSKYDVVYFNYGLHGYYVTDKEYEKKYREMIDIISKKSKVIIGLTTTVEEESQINEGNVFWTPVVNARKRIAKKIGQDLGIVVDDLHSISSSLGWDGKLPDGVHFNDNGNDKIGKSKAAAIIKLLR